VSPSSRDLARRSTLQALAVALGTDPGRLLGIAPPEQDTAGAEQLRRAVHALDLWPGPRSTASGCSGRCCSTPPAPPPGKACPVAEDLLRAALAAAARSSVDRVDETGVFGPRVAAMQAVDQAMRTGDPDRAVQLAAQVPTAAGLVPAFWESGHRPARAGQALRPPIDVNMSNFAPRGGQRALRRQSSWVTDGCHGEGLAHGDLSPFNLLVHRGRLVLIDLPQVVDIVANPQGPAYLARDVRIVTDWFTVHGLHPQLANAGSARLLKGMPVDNS